MEEPTGSREPLAVFRRPIAQDIGLALGAVGLLGLLGGAALFILVSQLEAWALRLIGAGIILVLFSLLLAWRPILSFARARQGRYGLNTTVMVLALVAILVSINILSVSYPIRIDLTATQFFTLSPQTLQVLQRLEKPVTAYGFFSAIPQQAIERAGTENLLREYKLQGQNFDYQMIDFQAKPAEAIRLGVTEDGTVVFEAEDRREQATEFSERGFTTALLQVTGQELKKVCFLAGHGERSIYEPESQGYSDASEGLKRDNYLVDTFNSAKDDPEELADCAVLVVAGPTQDLTVNGKDQNPSEAFLLEAFLAEGGKALFLLDPDAPESFKALVEPWGVQLGSGTVIDPQSRAERTTPIVDRERLAEAEGFTTITEDLDTTFFPVATSVDIEIDPDNPGPVALAQIFLATDPLSWLETAGVEDAQFTAGEDLRGPVHLGAVLQGQPSPEREEFARLAVIGDSDFARNDYFLSRNNGDLFLNTVNWLAEREYLIAVRPKPSGYRVLLLTDLQWRFILISSLALLPLAVSVVGGVTWWLRR